MKSRPEKPIVWVDCEMTGLDVLEMIILLKYVV